MGEKIKGSQISNDDIELSVLEDIYFVPSPFISIGFGQVLNYLSVVAYTDMNRNTDCVCTTDSIVQR